MKAQIEIPASALRLLPAGMIRKFEEGPFKGYTATGIFYVHRETGFDVVIINPNGLEATSSPSNRVRPIVVKATRRPDDTVQLEYA
jgi:hypothetical protein